MPDLHQLKDWTELETMLWQIAVGRYADYGRTGEYINKQEARIEAAKAIIALEANEIARVDQHERSSER